MKKKKTKVKLSHRPSSETRSVSVSEEGLKPLVVGLGRSLVHLAGTLQGIVDEMVSINPNIHPIRPITKIAWQESLQKATRDALLQYRQIPEDLRDKLPSFSEDLLRTGT